MNMHKRMGFTLLEMLLVLAIMGGALTLALNYGTRQAAQQRRDKIALQMQQILNAGLAYYTDFGTWPVSACNFLSTGTNSSSPFTNLSSATLISTGYLPASVGTNAFGYTYKVACDSVTGSVFYVSTQLNNKTNALIVAGELPVGYLSDANGNASTTSTYVTAQVTTPGQNLNNARSLNFAGVYRNGGCVPVPACPGYNLSTLACNSGTNCMQPQIMVAAASVNGVSDSNSTNVYPITGFTAYASSISTTPTPCLSGQPTSCTTPGGSSPTTYYWRVCLQVVTGKGVVSSTNTGTGANAWGEYTALVAMTRCAPPSEPTGSDFTVYTR